MTELTALGTAQLAAADSIAFPGSTAAETLYMPEQPGTDYEQRFERAIQCARQWRE